MEHKEFYQLTDDYLQGNLSKEMQEAFEEHYFSCDTCFNHLQISHQLQRKEVRITIPQKKTYWFARPALILSSLLVVVLSAVILFQSPQPVSITFEPPAYISTEQRTGPILANPEIERKVAAAMSHYQKGDYRQTLHALKKIPEAGVNFKVTFFKGICYLMTDNFQQALPEFNKIIRGMNPSYYDEALYYKSITLLKLKRTKQSVIQLNTLANMFSPYAEKAKNILQQIGKKPVQPNPELKK
jgi:tetratricopeptide (TPR) repeat protein